jgi:hypothetical protein
MPNLTLPLSATLLITLASSIVGAAQTPTQQLKVEDVVGGNDEYLEIPQPDPDQPIPLPNPAVVQLKAAPARSQIVTVKLGAEQRTEIKAVLEKAQAILYSWKVTGGEVYTDFHGHAPNTGKAFVRYEEQQSGSEGHGSLVAPFAGEHGW